MDKVFLESLYALKHEKLLNKFPSPATPQSLYQTIMELGKTLPQPSQNIACESYLVKGCQSLVYLQASIDVEKKMHFQVQSDALISSGLAALLLWIYDREVPDLLIHSPPLFIRDLGLHQHLTPGRSNGLMSMYLRMKQEAIRLILQENHRLAN